MLMNNELSRLQQEHVASFMGPILPDGGYDCVADQSVSHLDL